MAEAADPKPNDAAAPNADAGADAGATTDPKDTKTPDPKSPDPKNPAQGATPASGADAGSPSPGAAPDFSSVPEAFLADGKPDLAAYRLAYDEMAAFKAKADEKTAALPKKAEDYGFDAPEDLTPFLPEGFKMPEGMELEFADKDSIAALKAMAFEEGLPQSAVTKIRDMLVKHNIGQIASAMKARGDELKLLGPNADSRVSVVQRAAEARLPAEQAKALVDSITSADSLRAVETLLSAGGGTSRGLSDPGGKPNWGEMSINERLKAATELRAEKRKRA